ncbi:MAG: hypothetical protein M1455_06325 [Actinobacteria bacterium]|nr:hypothetical protein [Actinomycetota bacterium]
MKVVTPFHVMSEIMDELEAAEQKHPGWPDDLIHATAIVAEESGEAIQAAIDFMYSDLPEGCVLNTWTDVVRSWLRPQQWQSGR